MVDSVGTIRSYEFARDIRKDIEGNPFAGKMHPVPLADYKNGQQATPEAYHAALLHKQLFLGRSTPSSPRSKWISCCCRWPSPPPRP